MGAARPATTPLVDLDVAVAAPPVLRRVGPPGAARPATTPLVDLDVAVAAPPVLRRVGPPAITQRADLTLKTLPDPQFCIPWKGLSCEGADVDRAERVTALPTTSLWIQYATEGVPSELGFHPQSFFAVPPHPLWSAVVLRLPKVLRYGHLFLRGVLGFGSSLTIPGAPDFTQRGLAARRTVFPPHDR